MSTIPPNNNTGLYNTTGAVVPVNDNILANNISATGNVIVNGYITSNGSITTNSNFVGSLIGNVTAPGNITANAVYTNNYFYANGQPFSGGGSGNYGNANVAAFLPTYGGNVNATTVFANNVAVQGRDWAQLQYAPDGVPHDQNSLGTGSWLYLDSAGAAFESNTTGSVKTVFFGNDGQVNAQGNITAPYFLGNGSQLTGLPATYGNANVAAYLPTYSGNLNPGTISATGNITGQNLKTSGTSGNIVGANYVSAGYFVGDGGLLTNVVATSSYGNSNVAAYLPTYGGTVLANLINFTNNSGVIEQGDQRITITGNATQVNTGAYFNDTGEAAIFASSYVTIATNTTGNVNPTWTFNQFGDLSAPGNITATGNVTGNYILGNGSQLTGIAATYGNSNVTTLLASFGSNTISTSGNITGNYIFGNGSHLTGLGATYSNANVTSLMASFGSNSISTSGNVTAGYHIGNGSTLSSITGSNVLGTVANATYATSAGSATTATSATTAGTVTTNAQPNITSVGTLTGLSSSGNITTAGILTNGYYYANGTPVTFGGGSTYGNSNVNTLLAAWGSNTLSTTGTITAGNVTGGNILTGGIVSATGNITGNYFIGNGSALTGITATANAGGSNTQLQYNNGGVFAGNTAMTFNNTTGNVTFNNLVNSPLANSVYMYNTVATDVSTYNASGTPILGRTIYGTPFAGNLVPGTQDLNNALKSSKFVVTDSLNYGTNGAGYSTLASQTYITLTANISNSVTNFGGFKSTVAIGGGSAGNTISTASAAGGIIGQNFLTTIGGFGTTYSAIGNTTLTHTIGSRTQVTVNSGSNVGNVIAQAINTVVNAPTVQYSYQANTIIGLGITFNGNATIGNALAGTGNIIAVYLPSYQNTYGISTANTMRSVASYYFLKNDDPVAISSIGTLKTYQDSRYSLATSGTITIDKTNGQTQICQLTGDVTVSSFSNFVTSTQQVGNFYTYQSDTVKVIFQQGASGANITLPTGTNYKYANGVSTLGNTANTYQTVTITSNDATGNTSATGTVQYLITVSPVFS